LPSQCGHAQAKQRKGRPAGLPLAGRNRARAGLPLAAILDTLCRNGTRAFPAFGRAQSKICRPFQGRCAEKTAGRFFVARAACMAAAETAKTAG